MSTPTTGTELTAGGAERWDRLSDLADLAWYEVDAERCERDLLAFLQELAAQGLVEVEDAAGA